MYTLFPYYRLRKISVYKNKYIFVLSDRKQLEMYVKASFET